MPPLRYGTETNSYERDEQAAAIGHTRAQHDRERGAIGCASPRGSVQSCRSTTALCVRSENRERVQGRSSAARNAERRADEQKRPAAPLPRFAGQPVEVEAGTLAATVACQTR